MVNWNFLVRVLKISRILHCVNCNLIYTQMQVKYFYGEYSWIPCNRWHIELNMFSSLWTEEYSLAPRTRLLSCKPSTFNIFTSILLQRKVNLERVSRIFRLNWLIMNWSGCSYKIMEYNICFYTLRYCKHMLVVTTDLIMFSDSNMRDGKN